MNLFTVLRVADWKIQKWVVNSVIKCYFDFKRKSNE